MICFVVLFIYGVFVGGWMWIEIFMFFFVKVGYFCYVLLLCGYGGSDGWDYIDWYLISDYVDDVKIIVDWLGELLVLVGYLMGGFFV